MIYMTTTRPSLAGFGCPPGSSRFRTSPAGAGAGMGNVAALLVSAEQGTDPHELVGRGMAGMDDGLLDTLTGGKVSQISEQLDTVALLLKVSAAAAGFAGLTALGLLLFGRR